MERNVEAKTITNDVKRKMIAKALEAQRFSKRTTERFSRFFPAYLLAAHTEETHAKGMTNI